MGRLDQRTARADHVCTRRNRMLRSPKRRSGFAPTRKSRKWSLDQLVGAQQERLRDREPERLGGLEVDDQLKLGWRLHRQIARLFAAQDAISIACRASHLLNLVGPVGHQAAVGGVVTIMVDCRETESPGYLDDWLTMSRGKSIGHHDQPASLLTRELRELSFDLGIVVYLSRGHVYRDSRGNRLNRAQVHCCVRRCPRVEDDRCSGYAGRGFFEQLEPFPAEAWIVIAKPRRVTPRPRYAGDDALAHRIGHLRKYDRDCAGLTLQLLCCRRGDRHDDLLSQFHQVGCIALEVVAVTTSPAIIDVQVAALDPS